MNGSNYSYRRRLPHWRLSSATYFVTWRLHNTQAPLSEGERRITAETIQHFDGERFTLFAFVVMDDHVHAIVEPRSGQSVDGIVHSWKSFSAHRLQKETGRAGALWQHESYDHVIRNERELIELATYVWNNPQKRWPNVTDYVTRMVRGMEQGAEAGTEAGPTPIAPDPCLPTT